MSLPARGVRVEICCTAVPDPHVESLPARGVRVEIDPPTR